MDIYLYIFIITLVSVFVMLIAINACLKSHDKLFEAIEKVKQIKASNTNELSWKPSKEQIEALEIACTIREGERNYYLHTLYDDLKKL